MDRHAGTSSGFALGVAIVAQAPGAEAPRIQAVHDAAVLSVVGSTDGTRS